MILQTLKYYTKSWISKILFLVLILSFIIWNIFDIFKSIKNNNEDKNNNKCVLELKNNTKIYLDDFLKILNNQKTSKGLNDNIDSVFAIKTLEIILNKHIVNGEANRLNFLVSESSIKNNILKFPMFLDNKGNFSISLFKKILKENNIEELDFIKNETFYLLKKQILLPFILTNYLHENYLKDLYEELFRQYTFELISLSVDDIKDSDLPKILLSDLYSFYKTNMNLFYKPEEREVSVLIINPDKLKKKINIPLQKVESYYLLNKETDYLEEEKRKITEFLVSKSKFQSIKSILDKSGSTRAIINNLNNCSEVIVKDLGFLSENNLSLKESNLLFSNSNKTLPFLVGPVEDMESNLIKFYQVSDIKPKHIKSFDEVKDSIYHQLLSQKINDEINYIQNQIEDMISNGLSLKDISRRINIDLYQFKALKNEKDIFISREYLFDNKMNEAFLKRIFDHAFKISLNSIAKMNLENSGIILLTVNKITNREVIEFKIVKEKIIQLIKYDKRKQILLNRIKDFSTLKSYKEKDTMIGQYKWNKSRIITDYVTLKNYNSKMNNGNERIDNNKQIKQYLLSNFFKFKINDSKNIKTIDSDNYFLITLVKKNSINSKKFRNINDYPFLRDLIELSLYQDLISSYINSIKDRYIKSINEELLINNLKE